MAFTLYYVDATYASEHQTETIIGCGCVCHTEEEALEAKDRYAANPRVASVEVTANHYGK